MANMPALPSFVGELTVDDIDRTPDDGLRYELLDGTVLVSPLPSLLHQRVVGNLLMALHPNCPPDHEVFPRLDWRPDRHTSLQPDVLVLNDRDVETFDPDSMVLAVEVTSPQSRRTDTLAKRSRYEEAASRTTGSSTRPSRRSWPWNSSTGFTAPSARPGGMNE